MTLPAWQSFHEDDSKGHQNFVDFEDAEKVKNNCRVLLNREYNYQNLKKELNEFQLGEKAKSNLNKLIKGEAVVVITGQQPGVLVGPSLVLHKVLSVITIVSELKAKGIEAIPIFWNASEDHDLIEISKTTLWQGDLALTPFRMQFNELPVSAEKLLWTEELNSLLNEQSDYVKGLLEGCPKRRYADHVTQIMLNLFSHEGLLVIEPNWLRKGQLPLWEKVDQKHEAIFKAFEKDEAKLVERGELLQAERYHGIPVFSIHKETGVRDPFHYDKEGWSKRGKKIKSLLDVLSEGEKLSPGALLRPAFAQFSLPIIASVLGPAEYQYHKQNRSVFTELKLNRPALLPRLSGVWIPKPLKELCLRFKIEVEELLKGLSFLPNVRYKEKDDFRSEKESLWNKMSEGLSEDSKADMKISFELEMKRFEDKMLKKLLNLEQKEQGLSRQKIHNINEFILPKGVRQERLLNPLSFIKDKAHLKAIQKEFIQSAKMKVRVYE